MKRKPMVRTASLSSKAVGVLNEAEIDANRSWNVYSEALDLAAKALPMPHSRDYQILLNRIGDGFR